MRSTPLSIKYILYVYATGLLFFTFFRCILILTNLHQLDHVPNIGPIISYTMFMGFRFDSAVSGYILALPALTLIIAELCGFLRKPLLLAAHVMICLLYTAAIFLCAVDIPFFANYNNRLNVTILNWTNSPMFMAKMVWQDNTFLGYFLLFILCAVAFIILIARAYKKTKYQLAALNQSPNRNAYLYKILLSVFFLALTFLAIRGRTDEKSPILAGTAYFCNYSLPNQAGLNPVFTFMWSITDISKDENKPFHLIDDDIAAANVKCYLHLSPADSDVFRSVNVHTKQHRYNIVVVIMESMSAYYLQQFGNNMNVTPNLDTLAHNGYIFTNFYSAGIHTFNGIFSTLYGYPALMARHSMEGSIIPSYAGMPYFFTKRGYETMYFTTHDDQFDNVGGFLKANHMHTVISGIDYPLGKAISTLGVPDHYMLDFSIPILSKTHLQNKPFLAVYMTSSNHSPYKIPNHIPFQPKHTDVRGGCVEYTDWSVGRFMKSASAMPWYDSTIFVFLGDHGCYEGAPYGELPINYSHVPCIIYSPMLRDKPQVICSPAGQIDVLPTIAGLLGGDYINTTMGTDLLNDHRQWTFFSQDDKIGVADSADLYIWQKNGPEYMFNLAERKDILHEKRSKADSMRTYVFSMIQYAQWLRNNNKTGISH